MFKDDSTNSNGRPEMRRQFAVSASLLGGAAFLAGSLVGVSTRRWHERTRAAVDRLMRMPAPGAGEPRVSVTERDDVPEPVARYFRRAFGDGRSAVAAARIELSGFLNLSDDGEKWHPYSAAQTFRVDPPGYVWDARVRAAPFIDVAARDTYVDGHGAMRAAIRSLFGLFDEHDRGELDAIALQRYLAEAVLFPTALVPGGGVSWTAVDDTHAIAQLTHGQTTVALTFEFEKTGEVSAVATPARYRVQDGAYTATPWGASFRRHAIIDGMHVPTEADVYWVIENQRRTYFTLRVDAARYDFAGTTGAE